MGKARSLNFPWVSVNIFHLIVNNTKAFTFYNVRTLNINFKHTESLWGYPSALPPCSTFTAQRTSAEILWWWAKRRQMETKSLQDRKIQLWIHRAQKYKKSNTRSEGQRGQRNQELYTYSHRFGLEDVSTMLSLSWCQSKSIGKISHSSLTLSECRQFWLIFYCRKCHWKWHIPPRNFVILTNCIF